MAQTLGRQSVPRLLDATVKISIYNYLYVEKNKVGKLRAWTLQLKSYRVKEQRFIARERRTGWSVSSICCTSFFLKANKHGGKKDGEMIKKKWKPTPAGSESSPEPDRLTGHLHLPKTQGHPGPLCCVSPPLIKATVERGPIAHHPKVRVGK